MSMLRNTFALGASALVMAIAATPAYAQDAAAADQPAGGNPEIVVTAQFRSQKLQDTPLAITAVNSEMLEARSQTSVEQVAAQAPNVTHVVEVDLNRHLRGLKRFIVPLIRPKVKVRHKAKVLDFEAATSARKYASTVGRGICPSAQPCDHAAPELVEASALKPSCASQCAEPTSHGLGMTKQPLACSWRKAARRAAIAVGVGNMA